MLYADVKQLKKHNGRLRNTLHGAGRRCDDELLNQDRACSWGTSLLTISLSLILRVVSQRDIFVLSIRDALQCSVPYDQAISHNCQAISHLQCNVKNTFYTRASQRQDRQKYMALIDLYYNHCWRTLAMNCLASYPLEPLKQL